MLWTCAWCGLFLTITLSAGLAFFTNCRASKFLMYLFLLCTIQCRWKWRWILGIMLQSISEPRAANISWPESPKSISAGVPGENSSHGCETSYIYSFPCTNVLCHDTCCCKFGNLMENKNSNNYKSKETNLWIIPIHGFFTTALYEYSKWHNRVSNHQEFLWGNLGEDYSTSALNWWGDSVQISSRPLLCT